MSSKRGDKQGREIQAPKLASGYCYTGHARDPVPCDCWSKTPPQSMRVGDSSGRGCQSCLHRSPRYDLGATLGTTSTHWLVAIFGLRFRISAAALPLLALGAILWLVARGRTR